MMKKNKNANYAADARTVGTLIGAGAVFDGNLSAPETVRIDGTLNGNCDCKAQLIVGVEGVIKGDINAQNVLISGKVEGDIISGGKIELLSTGKIAGNITAKSLVIDEDACFDGRCSMTTTTTTTSSSFENSKNADNSADNKNGKDNRSDSDNEHNNKKK